MSELIIVYEEEELIIKRSRRPTDTESGRTLITVGVIIFFCAISQVNIFQNTYMNVVFAVIIGLCIVNHIYVLNMDITFNRRDQAILKRGKFKALFEDVDYILVEFSDEYKNITGLYLLLNNKLKIEIHKIFLRRNPRKQQERLPRS